MLHFMLHCVINQRIMRLMLKQLKWCLTIFLVLFLSMPVMAGDSKDDGGILSFRQIRTDVNEYKFRLKSYLVRVTEDPSIQAEFLEKHSITEVQFSVLLTAIHHAEVLVEYGQLTVAMKSPFGTDEEYMVPVDAINNDYYFHIRIGSSSWATLSPCNKMRLLAHEYASLADIEGSLQDHFSRPLSLEFKECNRLEGAYDFDSIEDLMGFDEYQGQGLSF